MSARFHSYIQVRILKSFLYFNALNSACGLPLREVQPDEITELFFTTTHPTEGFVLVLPRLTFAILKADLNKY